MYSYLTIAGLLAATMMIMVMGLVGSLTNTNTNLIMTFGRLISKTQNQYLTRGMLLHFTAGCVFAIIYYNIWNFLHIDSFIWLMVSGGIIGCFHGLLAG